MHHTHSALLRHRNRQPGLCHRIHRGRHQRCRQRNPLRELHLRAHLRRHNFRVCGDQQHVVERERFFYVIRNHNVYCCTVEL